MASLVGRKMFWALNHKAVPCLVVEQDLVKAQVTVLLSNGARHVADAYDVRGTEAEARERMDSLRKQYDLELHMANNHSMWE